MENNKNNKNNKIINKILTFFMLMVFMLSSVSAVSLNYDQDYTGGRYTNSDVSVITTDSLHGSDNHNYTYNNVTYVYDTRHFISYLDTEYYISYDNDQDNSTLEIILSSFPESGDYIADTYTITMDKVGRYHFLVNPSYAGENIKMEVNAPTGYVNELTFTTTKNKYVENIDTITGVFVGAMKDLIDINIGFWKMFYYIFIIGVVISALGLLINFAFKTYDWAERLGAKKKKMFRGRE